MSESAQSTAELAIQESYSHRVARNTLSQLGARLGLAWVGLVALLAVFAPFVANSHPYVSITADGWQSPLLQHLDWADVSLLVMFVGSIVAWRLRHRILSGRLLLALTALALITSAVTLALIDPPKAVVFDQYRIGLADGRIQSAVFAPVPFSPTDRSRDNPLSLQAPDRLHWFGTDEDGADVLSRMIHACRIALAIGLMSTGIALFIGILYGGVMGFFGGWLDIAMMRFLEMFEAIPSLFLLLMVVAFFGRKMYLILIVIGLT